jgi:hypothetical protein
MLFLNLDYPIRTLAGKLPIQAFPQAGHFDQIYAPEIGRTNLQENTLPHECEVGRNTL